MQAGWSWRPVGRGDRLCGVAGVGSRVMSCEVPGSSWGTERRPRVVGEPPWGRSSSRFRCRSMASSPRCTTSRDGAREGGFGRADSGGRIREGGLGGRARRAGSGGRGSGAGRFCTTGFMVVSGAVSERQGSMRRSWAGWSLRWGRSSWGGGCSMCRAFGVVIRPGGLPCFVMTHRPPEEWVRDGSLFTFVTGGVESALAQARAVAGDRTSRSVAGRCGPAVSPCRARRRPADPPGARVAGGRDQVV